MFFSPSVQLSHTPYMVVSVLNDTNDSFPYLLTCFVYMSANRMDELFKQLQSIDRRKSLVFLFGGGKSLLGKRDQM